MPDTLSIEQRVAAGAAYLDKRAPGWVAQIDLDSLDIEEPCDCILGQIYGHYFKSPRDARINDTGRADIFANSYIADTRGFNGSEEDMGRLTAAWFRLILSRREAVTQ